MWHKLYTDVISLFCVQLWEVSIDASCITSNRRTRRNGLRFFFLKPQSLKDKILLLMDYGDMHIRFEFTNSAANGWSCCPLLDDASSSVTRDWWAAVVFFGTILSSSSCSCDDRSTMRSPLSIHPTCNKQMYKVADTCPCLFCRRRRLSCHSSSS